MIKVLLVDDHAIVRQGLKALLANVNDIEVIAEGVNGRDAMKKARTYKPNVIIMDFSMPDLNGLEGTRKIIKQFPKIKVIALSMHADEEYVTQFIRVGASGYLLKDSVTKEDLVGAIREAMVSEEFISPGLSPTTAKRIQKQLEMGGIESPVESLTNREREVLQLIAEGLTNKGIAQKLSISVKTVQTHRAHIMNKLDIHNQASLTRFAVKHNIIDVI